MRDLIVGTEGGGAFTLMSLSGGTLQHLQERLHENLND